MPHQQLDYYSTLLIGSKLDSTVRSMRRTRAIREMYTHKGMASDKTVKLVVLFLGAHCLRYFVMIWTPTSLDAILGDHFGVYVTNTKIYMITTFFLVLQSLCIAIAYFVKRHDAAITISLKIGPLSDTQQKLLKFAFYTYILMGTVFDGVGGFYLHGEQLSANFVLSLFHSINFCLLAAIGVHCYIASALYLTNVCTAFRKIFRSIEVDLAQQQPKRPNVIGIALRFFQTTRFMYVANQFWKHVLFIIVFCSVPLEAYMYLGVSLNRDRNHFMYELVIAVCIATVFCAVSYLILMPARMAAACRPCYARVCTLMAQFAQARCPFRIKCKTRVFVKRFGKATAFTLFDVADVEYSTYVNVSAAF